MAGGRVILKINLMGTCLGDVMLVEFIQDHLQMAGKGGMVSLSTL
jgi:hypothetical protein